MPEDQLDLLGRHAGKPFEKIVNICAAFEVLEQRLNRHARAFEQPFAADLSRNSFDRGATAPVQHGTIRTSGDARGQALTPKSPHRPEAAISAQQRRAPLLWIAIAIGSERQN